MHKHSPKAMILIVTKTKMANGDYVVNIHNLESRVLPYRVAKRYSVAHTIGLEYVRALGTPSPTSIDPAGIIAITVTDGKRALGSWRRMEGLAGFTGTHDVYPLIQAALQH